MRRLVLLLTLLLIWPLAASAQIVSPGGGNTNGTIIGGACTAPEFMQGISVRGEPDCATPAGGGGGNVPNGSPPQVVGYSAANTGAAITIGGDFTLAASGPNAYTATVLQLNGTVPGGACGAGEFVNAISNGAVPTCAPALGGGPAVGPTPPPNPVAGDLWVNTSGSVPTLEVYDGAAWVVASNPSPANTSPTPPASPIVGQIWYDSNTNPATMKIWDGAAWVAVGGEWAPVTNPTGGANNYAPIASPTFTGVITGNNATFINGLTSMTQLQLTTNTISQVLFPPASTPQGSISSGTALGMHVAQGATYNGTTWIANNLTASILQLRAGVLNLYSNSGLGIVQPYTPTLIATIGPSGTDLPGPLTINGAPIGNFAPLTNPGGGQNNYAPIAGPTFTGTVRFPDNTTAAAAGFSFGQRATFGSGATINFGLTSANQSTFQGAATFNSTMSTGPISVQTTGGAPSITIQSGGEAIDTGQIINAGGYRVSGVAFGGTCPAGEYVNAISGAVIPTCATPAGGGGGAPGTNPPGGANNYAPIASPTFTGTVTAPILSVTGAATFGSTLTLNANAAAPLQATPLQQVQALIAAIPPPAGGSITDAMLANAYSGVGACPAGEFASTLNRNAAPTCTAPAGGNFAPLVNPAGGQNNYAPIDNPPFTGTIELAGVPFGGTCPAGEFVNAVSNGVVPTCAVPLPPGVGGWGPWIDESSNVNVTGARWWVRELPDHTSLQMYFVSGPLTTPVQPGATIVLGYLGQNNWSFDDLRFDYRTGAYSWTAVGNGQGGSAQHTPVVATVRSAAPSPPIIEVRNSSTDVLNDIAFAVTLPWGGPSTPQVFPTGTPLTAKKPSPTAVSAKKAPSAAATPKVAK